MPDVFRVPKYNSNKITDDVNIFKAVGLSQLEDSLKL